ncbi:MAG: amine dehydrogenase [Proteobacteria bacterium]|nr:amine dehydrogenase [Pseudomonadota bacterium]
MWRAEQRRRGRPRALACAAVVLAAAGHAALAQLPVEPLVNEPALPAHPGPHWVWVNDVVFDYMADGRAYLIDADAGKFRGMLSTGYGYVGVVPARTSDVLYSPETYFARGTRGARTDVVTLYDPKTLSPAGEVPIPPKRAAIMPMVNASVLTDDERFLLIYNFTPAQSVSVVDTKSRRFVGELDTAGCALVYPTGPRSFFSICADGSLLKVGIDEQGKATGSAHTGKLIDAENDPVTEKGVRSGDTYWFVSFKGQVLPLKVAAGEISAGPRWWLTSAQERRQWRPGGLQHLAIHRSTHELYAIMHQGGEGTHKDPGNEVWVFDTATGARTRKITLASPAGSIQVTEDDKPLLLATFIGSHNLEVYDARSGKHLRTVPDIGLTPTTMLLP